MHLHPITRVWLGNVAAIFWPTEADFSVCRESREIVELDGTCVP
jgi:hypothetical protein